MNGHIQDILDTPQALLEPILLTRETLKYFPNLVYAKMDKVIF